MVSGVLFGQSLAVALWKVSDVLSRQSLTVPELCRWSQMLCLGNPLRLPCGRHQMSCLGNPLRLPYYRVLFAGGHDLSFVVVEAKSCGDEVNVEWICESTTVEHGGF